MTLSFAERARSRSDILTTEWDAERAVQPKWRFARGTKWHNPGSRRAFSEHPFTGFKWPRSRPYGTPGPGTSRRPRRRKRSTAAPRSLTDSDSLTIREVFGHGTP